MQEIASRFYLLGHQMLAYVVLNIVDDAALLALVFC